MGSAERIRQEDLTAVREVRLTVEQALLLGWLIAREDGAVARCSALHANALMGIGNPRAVANALAGMGLVEIEGPTWASTQRGRAAWSYA